jgi:hypothetical protein
VPAVNKHAQEWPCFEAVPSGLTTFTVQLVPSLMDGMGFSRFTKLENLTLSTCLLFQLIEPSAIENVLKAGAYTRPFPQLNLSRFCHSNHILNTPWSLKIRSTRHTNTINLPLYTPQTPPIPQKVFTLSWKVDECKPLPGDPPVASLVDVARVWAGRILKLRARL